MSACYNKSPLYITHTTSSPIMNAHKGKICLFHTLVYGLKLPIGLTCPDCDLTHVCDLSKLQSDYKYFAPVNTF